MAMMNGRGRQVTVNFITGFLIILNNLKSDGKRAKSLVSGSHKPTLSEATQAVMGLFL